MWLEQFLAAGGSSQQSEVSIFSQTYPTEAIEAPSCQQECDDQDEGAEEDTLQPTITPVMETPKVKDDPPHDINEQPAG